MAADTFPHLPLRTTARRRALSSRVAPPRPYVLELPALVGAGRPGPDSGGLCRRPGPADQGGAQTVQAGVVLVFASVLDLLALALHLDEFALVNAPAQMIIALLIGVWGPLSAASAAVMAMASSQWLMSSSTSAGGPIELDVSSSVYHRLGPGQPACILNHPARWARAGATCSLVPISPSQAEGSPLRGRSDLHASCTAPPRHLLPPALAA